VSSGETGGLSLLSWTSGFVYCLLMMVEPNSACAGEYEYIDVVCDKEESGDKSVECYIMDIDFQAHFEIARSSQQYNAALTPLPMVFMDKST
jgi:uncharacterized protein (TIGR01615 family)